MYKTALLTGVVVSLLLTGCASTSSKTDRYYTKKQYVRMTYCLALADTARFVSLQKLAGTAKEKMVKFYSAKKNAKMSLAIVDTVYSKKIKNSWAYTVSFFNDCAVNVADVPRDRVKFGSYCSQNALIAEVAYRYRVQGKPKAKAYEFVSQFKSKTPIMIVDRVYASSMSRSETKIDAWNRCMKPISDE